MIRIKPGLRIRIHRRADTGRETVKVYGLSVVLPQDRFRFNYRDSGAEAGHSPDHSLKLPSSVEHAALEGAVLVLKYLDGDSPRFQCACRRLGLFPALRRLREFVVKCRIQNARPLKPSQISVNGVGEASFVHRIDEIAVGISREALADLLNAVLLGAHVPECLKVLPTPACSSKIILRRGNSVC